MTEPTALLLTSREAAELLQIGETTLRARVRGGELASIRIGRTVRFDRDDLKDFIARQRVGVRAVGLSTDLAPAVAIETTPPPAEVLEGGPSEEPTNASTPAEGRMIGASRTRENEAPTRYERVGARASSKGHSRDESNGSTGSPGRTGGAAGFWRTPTRTRDTLGVTP